MKVMQGKPTAEITSNCKRLNVFPLISEIREDSSLSPPLFIVFRGSSKSSKRNQWCPDWKRKGKTHYSQMT